MPRWTHSPIPYPTILNIRVDKSSFFHLIFHFYEWWFQAPYLRNWKKLPVLVNDKIGLLRTKLISNDVTRFSFPIHRCCSFAIFEIYLFRLARNMDIPQITSVFHYHLVRRVAHKFRSELLSVVVVSLINSESVEFACVIINLN